MSATIQSIEAVLVDIPTIRPHKLSMTTMGVQSMVIVRMTDSNGLEGLVRPPPSVAWLTVQRARKA